uniref:Uncharacterized protein n=1 Tax=Romanomermis culicivorax TaxID=13658 RepID=A0A915JXS5_ROMCU
MDVEKTSYLKTLRVHTVTTSSSDTLLDPRTAMRDKRAIKGHDNCIIRTKSTIALVVDNTQKRMLANKPRFTLA